jgi:hypothetical protein
MTRAHLKLTVDVDEFTESMDRARNAIEAFLEAYEKLPAVLKGKVGLYSCGEEETDDERGCFNCKYVATPPGEEPCQSCSIDGKEQWEPEKHEEAEQTVAAVRTCQTCLYYDIAAVREPCFKCLDNDDEERPLWEPSSC